MRGRQVRSIGQVAYTPSHFCDDRFVDAERLVARGEEALAQGRWEDARVAFEAALEQEESAAALLGLGGARWWLADAPGAVALMERAYTLLREDGAVADAVFTAVWLAAVYQKSLGNPAACSGWVARAARLLEEAGEEGALHGWVWLARSYEATDREHALVPARRALALAREAGDADLELCALGELGSVLVALGQVDEGLSLVDEAMTGALAGEFESPETVAATTCSMLVACDLVADLDRVTQWCRVADRFMRTYGCPFLFADCRMRYGAVLLATGHWQEAEEELGNALSTAPAETDYHLRARVCLAELRVRQGRLAEAEALVADAEERAMVRPVAAAIRHAGGEHALAAALLARHLDGGGSADVEAAGVLGLLVEANLGAGDVDAARAGAERLAALADRQGLDRVAAHAALASGRVALAAGAHADAAGLFEAAMERFARATLPYETARARLALAEALAADQPAVAVAEAQGACATFEQLGAPRDVDAAAALLRALGAPARTGPKGVGVLTQREQEVLGLLREGLSNPEIAERLFISRKTAAHHVSSVLSKLGLRNRVEAAAYAARAGAHGRG